MKCLCRTFMNGWLFIRLPDIGHFFNKFSLSLSFSLHMSVQPTPASTEDGPVSDEAVSDGFSGSVDSFLANEKLMSVDSINSDLTGGFSALQPPN